MNKKRKNFITKTNSRKIPVQKVKPMSLVSKPKSESIINHYFIYNQLIEKYFIGLENSTPKYNQTMTLVQLEHIKFYENLLKLFTSFQNNTIANIEINMVPFRNSREIYSIPLENLLKIYILKFESYILSLESYTNIFREWNSLFKSYSNTLYKIFQYKIK